MIRKLDPNKDPGHPRVYQIRIGGQLGSEWTGWLEGLIISLEDNGDTLFTGPIADQAALFGLLRKVRDLGIPLISVIPAESSKTDPPDGGRR